MKILSKFTQWLENLVENHKLIRRFVVAWAVFEITWSTHILYQNLDQITPSVATVHSLTVGLLSTVLGFYMKLRSEELN